MQQLTQWLDRYTDHVELFVQGHVMLAPLLLLFAEEMGIPILVPGDAILGYVGFLLTQSHSVGLWEAFIVAFLSVLGGASILFAVAKRWGKQTLAALGKFIFLKQSHLEKAEKLFEKYGVWAIIFGRHIPGMRIPITIFAASAGVRYRTFMLSTAASTGLWILFYLSIGKRYGGDIQQTIHKYTNLSLGILIGLVVLVAALHFYGVYREKRREP